MSKFTANQYWIDILLQQGIVSGTSSFSVGVHPTGIVAGPDGNLWVADLGQDKVWKVTTAGLATGYTTTTNAGEVCTGPDNNLWFAAENYVEKVTTSGTPTTYSLSGGISWDICVGPDSNLWVSGNNSSNTMAWRVTTSGTVTPHILHTGEPLTAICNGPDGNLWGCEETDNIWKITTAGSGTNYNYGSGFCVAICTGPDGNLWAANQSSEILKITTSGVITPYTLGTSVPQGICTGPDGNLWVSDANGYVWRVNTDGTGIAFALPGSQPAGLCVGPDNNIWVTDFHGAVWKVVLAQE